MAIATRPYRRNRRWPPLRRPRSYTTLRDTTSDADDALSLERYRVIASGASRGIGGQLYYGYAEDLFGAVRRAFERHGLAVDRRHVYLERGLFEATWPARPAGGVAFAHVDCDWHDPVAYALEATAACLEPGGAILIDDYHDYSGAKVATDGFLARHPDYSMRDGPNVLLIKQTA